MHPWRLAKQQTLAVHGPGRREGHGRHAAPRALHQHLAWQPNAAGSHRLTEPGSSASPDGSWYLLAPSRKHDTSRRWSAVSTRRSEEHTSELQSLMRISYAVFCLKKTKNNKNIINTQQQYKTHQQAILIIT